MKRVPFALALLIATCSAGTQAGQRETDLPELGMFAVQSPHQWQLEQDKPAMRRLTRVTPTSLFIEAGVTWVRLPLMNLMQRDPASGNWTFRKDPYIEELRTNGIRIFGTISLSTFAKGSERRVRYGGEPSADDEARWLEEVRALVTHHKGKVWIWQIGNEFEKTPYSLEAYIRLFEKGSRLIRELVPGVPIAAGGFTSGDFEKFADSTWPGLLSSKTPPDVLDFHFHTYAGRWGRLDAQLTELVEMRDAELPRARLIMTENSTFTGKDVPYPWEDNRKITQSEADQAAEQIKRAAIALGHGVSVSFGTDMDKPQWRKQGIHPFSHNGLVYNPRRTYGTDKLTRSWPKSAWWSLRLMTRFLDDDPPTGVSYEVVDSAPAPRLHLATFHSDPPSYLAWIDSEEKTPITLEDLPIEAGRISVVEAVPRVDGKRMESSSWLDRFRSRSAKVRNGSVTLDLSATPVWIRPAGR